MIGTLGSSMVVLQILLLAAPERCSLIGTVTDSQGSSLTGATVFIYTATVRSGTSTICDSCYPDCSKRAVSDRRGQFRIPSLSPELLFRILVVADGYAPKFADRIDPALAPITVSLTPIGDKRTKPDHCLRGRVVDDRGRPVYGAKLTPIVARTSQYFSQAPKALDPVAVTNGEGHFLMTSSERIVNAILRVEARGFASMVTSQLAPSETEHILTVQRGAVVKGRVRQGGKPVAGISMGLVQVDRRYFLHEMQTATDEHGEFLFRNVPANQDFYIYGKMASLGYRGAILSRRLSVGKDGETIDVGNIDVKPGHRLSGQIVLSDGNPLPSHVRVGFGRSDAWDVQDQELDDVGRFSFDGIPDELIVVQVYVPGYRLSSRNKSLERTTRGELKGMVDRDIDLRILLEPGKRQHYSTTRKMVELQEAQNRSLIEGAPNAD